MKVSVVAVVAVVALLVVCGCANHPQNRAGDEEAEFASFLQEWKVGQEAFINGDPTAWKANTSHSSDATIFGGFGGVERGWEEVGERYDWAASQFQPSGASKDIEYLTTGVSSGLAFSVAIEHSRVRIGDESEGSDLGLRVTQIFRKESGSWKLLHRHADPMLERRPPGS